MKILINSTNQDFHSFKQICVKQKIFIVMCNVQPFISQVFDYLYPLFRVALMKLVLFEYSGSTLVLNNVKWSCFGGLVTNC